MDFAEKFGIYECQLRILKTSRHSDQKIIEYLWKNIIANGKITHHTSVVTYLFISSTSIVCTKELDKMIELYPEKNQLDEQKNAFANAFVSIAESYIEGDEKYFPLRKACQLFPLFLTFFFKFIINLVAHFTKMYSSTADRLVGVHKHIKRLQYRLGDQSVSTIENIVFKTIAYI